MSRRGAWLWVTLALAACAGPQPGPAPRPAVSPSSQGDGSSPRGPDSQRTGRRDPSVVDLPDPDEDYGVVVDLGDVDPETFDGPNPPAVEAWQLCSVVYNARFTASDVGYVLSPPQEGVTLPGRPEDETWAGAIADPDFGELEFEASREPDGRYRGRIRVAGGEWVPLVIARAN